MTTPAFTFDRNGAKAFHAILDAKLADLGRELGLVIKTGTLRFDPAGKSFHVGIEANAGEASDAATFARMAPNFGLEAADFGRDLWGTKIVGLTNRGCVIVNRDGRLRRYKASALPSIVKVLHPSDLRKSAAAKIAVGLPTSEDERALLFQKEA